MIENECKTPYGCLTFIFYQKYFLGSNWLEGFLFSCDEMLCWVFLILLELQRDENENFVPFNKELNARMSKFLQNIPINYQKRQITVYRL